MSTIASPLSLSPSGRSSRGLGARIGKTVSSSGFQLAAPLALLLLLSYVLPLVMLLAKGFTADGSLESINLDQYRKFFGDPTYVNIFWHSVTLGLYCTLLCLILGYPLAYAFNVAGPRTQKVLTFLILLPLLTSIVVRTFAWVVILGREGLVNDFLRSTGIVDASVKMLFTHGGVVVSLSQIMLPFMILPLIASMSRVDMRLLEASDSLGAGAWRGFLRVFVPLTLPGIVGGSLLVFSIAISAFVTPSIIGAGKVLYLPNIIYQQAVLLLDWGFAAAVSSVLLVTVLAFVAGLAVISRLGRIPT